MNQYPLGRYHHYSDAESADPILPTRRDITVTDKDQASLAYFLSDPACQSFKLSI